MPEANYRNAITTAEKVLKDGFINQPPIPIIQLTMDYGLSIQFFTPSIAEQSTLKGVSGIIIPDQKLIKINNEDDPRHQIFTIAHELGHWLLHKNHLLENPEIGILFRRPIGGETDPIEQEANCFAANLLVPKSMLLNYLKYTKDEGKLAEIFNVSRQVIGYRLATLNRGDENRK